MFAPSEGAAREGAPLCFSSSDASSHDPRLTLSEAAIAVWEELEILDVNGWAALKDWRATVGEERQSGGARQVLATMPGSLNASE